MPPQLVDTCLNYGISGSILLRGVFIFAGLAATSAFAPLLLGFSLFLLASAYQLLAGGGDLVFSNPTPNPSPNPRPNLTPSPSSTQAARRRTGRRSSPSW